MKNKTEEIPADKSFDTVQYFRKVKESISEKIYGKSVEEIKAYFQKRKLEFKK